MDGTDAGVRELVFNVRCIFISIICALCNLVVKPLASNNTHVGHDTDADSDEYREYSNHQGLHSVALTVAYPSANSGQGLSREALCA